MNPMTTQHDTNAAGEAAHTFTLCQVPALDGSVAIAHEMETDGHTVAHIYPDTGEDYAAFIVRACNSHAALVDALEVASKHLQFLCDNLIDDETAAHSVASEVCQQARAALAQAKEGGAK
jgi:hypothetical protein